MIVSSSLNLEVAKLLSHTKRKEGQADFDGASFRLRLLKCILPGLGTTIIANVGNSTVQFLVVVACIRARSLQDAM